MNAAGIVGFALRGLTANKLRSGLTTLGILIGVAAVIILVAVGNGSSKQVQQSIERLGSNTLTVQPSTSGRGVVRRLGPVQPQQQPQQDGPRSQAHDLTIEDAQALADPVNAPSVKSASPVTTKSAAPATYQGTSHDIAQFVGTYASYFEATNSRVARGTPFTSEDVTSARNVVLLGTSAASELFGTTDPIGKEITVDGVNFTVTGVLKSKGSGGFQDADDLAIAPLTAVQQSLTGYGGLSQIVVQANSPGAVDGAEAETTATLDQLHDTTGTPDYSIMNQASLQSAVAENQDTFTVLLAAVAAISLLVGGIGITNIMLVTVTERTHEIGIRKAIGAPKAAILGQFLAEATVLSLIGGLAGVVAGVIGSQFTIIGVKPVIVPASVAGALAVAMVIGLFFGSFPANRAAKLRPIEALRHD